MNFEKNQKDFAGIKKATTFAPRLKIGKR